MGVKSATIPKRPRTKRDTAKPADIEVRSNPAGGYTIADYIASGGQFFLYGGGTNSGITIDPFTALTCTTYFACARLICTTLASLPLYVYEKTPDGPRRVYDHPMEIFFNEMPNAWMNGGTFVESTHFNSILWGNGVVAITRDPKNRYFPSSLMPLTGNKVNFVRTTRKGAGDIDVPDIAYEWTDGASGRAHRSFSEDVMHIRQLSINGIDGLNAAVLASESIGSAIQVERFAAAFWKNGAVQSGFVHYDSPRNETQRKEDAKKYKEDHTGVENAFKVGFLPTGAKFVATSMDMQHAQYIELRKHLVAVVCQAMGVPSHMVNDTEKSTYTVEQQSLDFYKGTINNELKRWEQEATRKIFRVIGDMKHFFKFDTTEIFRTSDPKVMADANATAIQWGYRTRNAIARDNNFPPVAGGDEPLQPLNMTTPSQLAAKLSGVAAKRSGGGLLEGEKLVIRGLLARAIDRDRMKTFRQLERKVKHFTAANDFPGFQASIGKLYDARRGEFSQDVAPFAQLLGTETPGYLDANEAELRTATTWEQAVKVIEALGNSNGSSSNG